MSARALCFQIGTALLLTIGGLWTATQWAAAMLAYQPALGAPLAEAFGCALYAPWKLFGWWLAFDKQAPHVFNSAGIMAATGGVASGAVALGGAAWRSGAKAQSATFGSARWAAISDLRKAKLLENKGVVLGTFDGHYLRHDGPEHVLTVAPTRSGKGVGLVLPTLLTWPGSAVIHDIKGENWTETAGWRSTFSECLRFDPTDPDCARFNPLQEVRILAAIAVFGLAIFVPGVAAGLVSGAPQLGAGAAVATTAAIGGSAVAGGILATGTARLAERATGGAVKAGASLTGTVGAAYLMSHRRPMAELLSSPQKDIAQVFANNFVGMIEEPVTLDELIAARAAMVAEVVGKMPQQHRAVHYRCRPRASRTIER